MKRIIVIVVLICLLIGVVWWCGKTEITSPPTAPQKNGNKPNGYLFTVNIDGKDEKIVGALRAMDGKMQIFLGYSLARSLPLEQFWKEGQLCMETVAITQRRVFEGRVYLLQRDVLPPSVDAYAGAVSDLTEKGVSIVKFKKYSPQKMAHELAHITMGQELAIRLPSFVSEGIARLCELRVEEEKGIDQIRHRELERNEEIFSCPALVPLDGAIEEELLTVQPVISGRLCLQLWEKSSANIVDLLDSVERGELMTWEDYLTFFKNHGVPFPKSQPGVYVLRLYDEFLDPPEDVYLFFRRGDDGKFAPALFNGVTEQAELSVLKAKKPTMFKLSKLRVQFPHGRLLSIYNDANGELLCQIQLR